jgi:hypothetical protein|tara:strand:- start:632 stop:1306 length:675 start_codon:yes stop_codon:yes gene_type:complete
MKKEVEQVVKSENDLTFKEIWDTLSAIDVSEYTEQKMNLTYLSWARAVMLVSNVYEMKYKFCDINGLPYRLLPDGSAEVITEITIGKHKRQMALPIMDYKNNPVKDIDARQLNDNRMRCLVKNLAMFGLGMSVFAQWDNHLPSEEKDEKPEVKDKHDEAWAKLFAESMELLIKKSKTVSDLTSLYTNDTNKPQFNILKERYADISDEILNKFKLKKTELENKEN